MLDAIELCFFAALARLLEQRNTRLFQFRQEAVQRVAFITLVGIDTEPHVRAHGAYFVDPLDIRIQDASELEFNRARTRIALSNFSHRCWLIRADSKGSEQRARRFNSSELPYRRPRSTRFKFPKSAIERVARTARGKQRSQLLARGTVLDRAAVRLDRGEHAISGIVQVVNAGRFTAPFYATVP